MLPKKSAEGLIIEGKMVGKQLSQQLLNVKKESIEKENK